MQNNMFTLRIRRAVVVGLAAALPLTAGVPAASAAAPHGVVWRMAWRAGLSHGNVLISVTATSPNQIWAIGSGLGESAATYIVRWNGRTWRKIAAPARNFVPMAVESSAASNIWMLGWAKPDFKPVAYIWNGRQWRSISLPAGNFVPTVVLGPSDAWLNAGSTRIGHHLSTILWHWNGSGWKSYQVPIGLDLYHGISGTSDKNLWMAGIQARRLSSAGWLAVYRWTGTAWRKAQVKRRWIAFAPGVSASWTGDVWVQAGSTKFTSGFHRAIVLHRHHGQWTQLPDRQLNDDGVADFPPTAVGHSVWFFSSSYWNGHTTRTVSFVSHGVCNGGIYQAGLVDMAEIPGTATALLAAGCPHGQHGRIQGALFISRPVARVR